MSWLFSQALVEEYSEDISSAGEPSVQSSGNPTQLAYLPPDRMTAFSRLSRFGMTFKPLTGSLGQNVLTSFLEDFPARTSQQQEVETASKERDPECGHTWLELLARFDPATFMWKTPQCSLLEDYTEFSETCPKWGLMQDGVLYQQQSAAPPHRRDRIWILANSRGIRLQGREVQHGSLQKPEVRKDQPDYRHRVWGEAVSLVSVDDWKSFAGKFFRVDDGLASRVDRLKSIGNGQVPAVAATAWRLLNDPA